jgi:hypothetical protein
MDVITHAAIAQYLLQEVKVDVTLLKILFPMLVKLQKME